MGERNAAVVRRLWCAGRIYINNARVSWHRSVATAIDQTKLAIIVISLQRVLLIATLVTVNVEAAANGELIYRDTCSACHNLGVAGAPKIGDKKAWEKRVDKGFDTLYLHAIQGFEGETGIMPPKGGFDDLSDGKVKRAVEYMISQGQ